MNKSDLPLGQAMVAVFTADPLLYSYARDRLLAGLSRAVYSYANSLQKRLMSFISSIVPGVA